MKHTVKVLLFIGTNFRGFDFKHYRQKSMGKNVFRCIFLFSWFKWTTKSTNNRTRPLAIISQYQLTFKYEK